MGVGVGGGAAHIPGVGEKIRGSPEQLHARALLELPRVRDELVQVPIRLGERLALGCDVAIMETPEGGSDFCEKFESCVHAIFRDGDAVRTFFPRPMKRFLTERIRARPAERVPVSDGEPQMRAHRFAINQLVGIIVAERQGLRGAGAFVGDRPNFWEISFELLHGKAGVKERESPTRTRTKVPTPPGGKDPPGGPYRARASRSPTHSPARRARNGQKRDPATCCEMMTAIRGDKALSLRPATAKGVPRLNRCIDASQTTALMPGHGRISHDQFRRT